ncbi:class I SAM-dependent methyltransferase [Sanguibacter antarcticus]|uniref:Methyltransferase family protein n=1 Tax=Sanguibacter antarcticus TaxID=372484 RepID=A0A2A9E5N9_9MICO|nr:methyltransferase [Sanguibacter antarcticus]PFG33490.1 methyltransferase family protein [Sanguibacter antarcticus]
MSDDEQDHYFTAAPASADERRRIRVRLDGEDREVETAGGIFSPGRIDLGTEVLLRSVAAPPDGALLDLGCGWGPIALTQALQNPRATVWAVDVNERSLDLVRRNAEILGITTLCAVRPEDVPEDVQLAEIWSNPPIRVGKAVLHSMLETWLPRLAPGASAYLVVQRHLGADSLQRWIAERFPEDEVRRTASAKGFRVIQVTRP